MSTELSIVVDGLRFPEGNRWHDGALWYADMHTGEVFRLGLGEKEPRQITVLDGQSSGMGWLASGELIVSAMNQRRIIRVSKEGNQSVYCDLSKISSSLINDLVLDEATGRAYVGAFGYDLYGGAEAQPGPLYCVEPKGASVRQVAGGLTFPNSAVIIPGTRTLVVGETWGGRMTAFDIEDDGGLSQRRTWAELEAGITPDGSCVDLEGGIWISSLETGEFQRIVEGGRVTDRIRVPGRHAVDCVLGGKNGTTLYLSSADSYTPTVTDGTHLGWIQATEVAVPGPVN